MYIRKNSRRKYLFLLLLLFVFISVGYAYLSSTLHINGTSYISKETWNIHFVEGTLDDSTSYLNCTVGGTCSQKVKETTLSNKNENVDFKVKFQIVGDYYEFTIDVINEGTIDAMLSEVIKTGITSSNKDYFKFDVTYADGAPIQEFDYLVKNGGRETIKVRVSFLSTPVEDIESDFSISMRYEQADSKLLDRAYGPKARIISLNNEGVSISTTDHENELRFIGADPNNYVIFNGNQKWRIIGIFDGRLKLIADYLPPYAYDISSFDVNDSYGINQWSESITSNGEPYMGADLMHLLNPGYEMMGDIDCISTGRVCDETVDYDKIKVNNSLYWNATAGNCYNGKNSSGNIDDQEILSCDFTSSGLKDSASKEMIDDVIWYTGTTDIQSWNFVQDEKNYNFTANNLYNWERSLNTAKTCNSGTQCTDNVERTTSWIGKVGLMYPSDYLYATSGGNTYNRNQCLNASAMASYDRTADNTWATTYLECVENDWLRLTGSWVNNEYLMTPIPYKGRNTHIFSLDKEGDFQTLTASTRYTYLRPVVYLKSSIAFLKDGDGSIDNPFKLIDVR